MSIDPTQRNLSQDSLLGMFRGAIVGTLVYPLKVVVVRQQCHPSPKTSAAVAWETFAPIDPNLHQPGMGLAYDDMHSYLFKAVQLGRNP